MHKLLTDDEIVALSQLTNRTWPLPLITVRGDIPASVVAATLRGRRSLIVRGMAGVDGEGIAVSSEFVALFDRALSSPVTVVAHASPIVRIGVSGSLVIAFEDHGRAIVDSVTATGIHAITESDVDNGRGMLLTYCRSMFRGDVPQAEEVCVLLAASDRSTVLRVRIGIIDEGTVDDGPGGRVFSPSAEDQADFTAVADFLARGA